MPAVSISPAPKLQFFTAAGAPLVGGKVYTYSAGTSTPYPTYTDSTGNVANSNPITLDARGEASIWLEQNVAYKFEIRDASNVLIYTQDNVYSLAQVTAANVNFTQSGTGAVTRSVQSKLRDVVSVKDFGAVGDGVTDDTAAIQSAINAASAVVFPEGTYLVSAQINLKDNLSLYGSPNSKILLKSGVTPYVLRGNTANNFVMRDMVIEGNGLAGYVTVWLSNSSNVTIQNCIVTKSGSTALYFNSCSFVKVEQCLLSNNYYYGLEFRDCDGCKAIANQCVSNGSTGVATSTGGRGIMLWRSRGCYIAGNRFVTNNEYGFRIYSEAADLTTSYNNVVTGNVFLDNTAGDLVLYDEGAAFSFVTHNVISDNVAYRTTNTTTLGAVFTLHGDYNIFANNHVVKFGTFGTDCAFNFYNASYCTISNSSARNLATAFSTSTSDNITIENCLGYAVSYAVTGATFGIVVKNCKFIHGGAGASDVAIINYNATGKNFYEGNYFDGFHTGFYIDNKAVSIFRNTTINSAFAGIRCGATTDIGSVEMGGNSFDSANPWELSALNKTVSVYDRAVTRYTAAPTNLKWAVGDRCFNSAPAVGSPKSWVCTVAGTPGTWVSEGNL